MVEKAGVNRSTQRADQRRRRPRNADAADGGDRSRPVGGTRCRSSTPPFRRVWTRRSTSLAGAEPPSREILQSAAGALAGSSRQYVAFMEAAMGYVRVGPQPPA